MDHQRAIDSHAAERYLLDELADAERDAFEEHFFSCRACADDVRAGAMMRDGVRAGLAETAPAVRPSNVVPIDSRRRWRTSVALPWAVAASLALVVGYQSVRVVPGAPASATATSPVLLRPASRGAVTTVMAPSSGVLAFALDLNAANPSSSLSYDLRTIDGRSVASGVVPAPPAGTPLILVVPVALVDVPGNYSIAIQDGGTMNTPVAEYRFAVAKP
jgi:hypothetical protein